MKFGTVYCTYDDHEYLELSLETFKHMDKVLFLVSDVPWNGDKSDNTRTIDYVKGLVEKYPNFEMRVGHWATEAEQRNAGLEFFFDWGIDYCFIVDTDEVYHMAHVEAIQKYILANKNFSAFHIEWNTYWTKDYYVINPREEFNPVICVKVSEYEFTQNRLGTTAVKRTSAAVFKNADEQGYNGILIPPSIAFCYHLSYARKDEVIKRKMETFSHSSEIVKGWYDNVWKTWTPVSQNLHPVTPKQYKQAVKENFIAFPEQLKLFIKKERMNSNLPCSIIILNWNSCDLLKNCLKLIQENTSGVIYSVIIVDNGSSKDSSVEYLKSLTRDSFLFPFKIVYNKENLGFAGGVNTGIRASATGSDVCLLNVDAEVQPGWLREMYETMNRVPDCGFVGPLGNITESRYQEEGMVKVDTLVPNLHFYCTLIFSEVIDKIGLFDILYGNGCFDDNDYGMRGRLAGYTHVISAKSLVKHEAHQVFILNGLDPFKAEMENKEKFMNKFFGVMLNYSRLYNYYATFDLAKETGLLIQ